MSVVDQVSVVVSALAICISAVSIFLSHRNDREWFRDQIVRARRQRRPIIGWTPEGWPIAGERNAAIIADIRDCPLFDPRVK